MVPGVNRHPICKSSCELVGHGERDRVCLDLLDENRELGGSTVDSLDCEISRNLKARNEPPPPVVDRQRPVDCVELALRDRWPDREQHPVEALELEGPELLGVLKGELGELELHGSLGCGREAVAASLGDVVPPGSREAHLQGLGPLHAPLDPSRAEPGLALSGFSLLCFCHENLRGGASKSSPRSARSASFVSGNPGLDDSMPRPAPTG